MTSAVLAALTCLSMNAYHEARGEPFLGQVAVSQVLLRRADFDPRRVCREMRRPGQFSWVGKARKPRSRTAWREAQLAARTAWLHAVVGGRTDQSHGADHYHATWIAPPRWTRHMRRVVTVGEHHFYKEQEHVPSQ